MNGEDRGLLVKLGIRWSGSSNGYRGSRRGRERLFGVLVESDPSVDREEEHQTEIVSEKPEGHVLVADKLIESSASATSIDGKKRHCNDLGN